MGYVHQHVPLGRQPEKVLGARNSKLRRKHEGTFQTFQKLPTACRLWQFCCRTRATRDNNEKQKDANSYYETVVKNTLQNSAVRRSGKQTFYLGTTAAIDLLQTFEIGTTEHSPMSRRVEDSLFKLKAIVDLRLCINLDTAEVSIFYHH